MKVALIVPRLTLDCEGNLATIEQMAMKAVSVKPDLILLPEAVLTGLINIDDPRHDMQLGQPIPGAATQRLGVFCARHRCRLGFGMFERHGATLFDSAVLLEPDGSVGLVYRRNQPHWHGEGVDPEVYCQGDDLPLIRTPFGSMAFLLCGDLFDDEIVSRFRRLDADWLLFPFARCFPDGSTDQVRWDTEELPAYARRVATTRSPALMVNYLADDDMPGGNYFGGAFVVSAAGEVLASHPLGREGILIVDIDPTLQR
jgi:predicted amidohydrolase